ncbi:hypothetical protein [Streptomyces sp. NBC_01431]|uniref:hypothetical protein n=1 Tax=Streptomyces sp. NBC_01431 TaxID=2903863 RepID=UPI002E3821CA|nr:hypothetical protein [Streptomyces sp. NBC_01431]
MTSYAEAKELLADARLSKDGAVEKFGRHIGLPQGPGSALFAHMLNSDPPHHTRLRKLVQKAFTAPYGGPAPHDRSPCGGAARRVGGPGRCRTDQ